MPRSNNLLAGTVVPVVIGLAVAAGSSQAQAGTTGGETLGAEPRHQGAETLQLASCNPCGPCNPCAAACSPCGPCNPCDPCAQGGCVL